VSPRLALFALAIAYLFACQAQHRTIGEAKTEAQRHKKVRVMIEAEVLSVEATVGWKVADAYVPQVVILGDGTGTVRTDVPTDLLTEALVVGDRLRADIEIEAPWVLANTHSRDRRRAVVVRVWEVER